jgi:hypothetical protein
MFRLMAIIALTVAAAFCVFSRPGHGDHA